LPEIETIYRAYQVLLLESRAGSSELELHIEFHPAGRLSGNGPSDEDKGQI